MSRPAAPFTTSTTVPLRQSKKILDGEQYKEVIALRPRPTNMYREPRIGDAPAHLQYRIVPLKMYAYFPHRLEARFCTKN
jgi:hypothetical protein